MRRTDDVLLVVTFEAPGSMIRPVVLIAIALPTARTASAQRAALVGFRILHSIGTYRHTLDVAQ